MEEMEETERELERGKQKKKYTLKKREKEGTKSEVQKKSKKTVQR